MVDKMRWDKTRGCSITSTAIGYIKMKCTESMVVGIPASHTTSKEVWDGLKEKFNKASAAIVLQEIQSAFSFRLSGGDPMHKISKLSAMFSHLLDQGFSIPDFIHALILIMVIPSKWDSVATFLLQQYALDKLDWDTVSESVISKFSCMKESNRPSTSANKISAVKRKDDHPSSWKGKSREDKPAASGSGSGDCKEKKGQSCAGKQVKQHREAAKECQHAHMAELAIEVNPPAPTASPLASPPAPIPLPVITTINSNGRIIPTPAFILKTLPAAIAAKPMLWNSPSAPYLISLILSTMPLSSY